MGIVSKLDSRKFFLTFLVLIFSVLLLVLPPLLMGQVLLNGTQFVSIVSITFSAYFATNVWQKSVEGQNITDDSVNVTIVKQEEGEA